MGQKRGQLTVFIIVGLVLLIGIGTVVYVMNRGPTQGATPEQRGQIEDPTTQLQGIVTECLRTFAIPVLQQLSDKGGTLLPPTVKWEGVDYSVICNDVQEFGCVNTLRTKRDIADEFDKIITPKIEACIDLTPLVNKGFTVISKGPVATSSIIGFDDVTTTVSVPIKLGHGADTITFNQIAERTQSPIGRLHSLALLLLKQESDNGYMDKDTFMKETGNAIHIDIDRPYPDTVITLNTTDNTGRVYLYHVAEKGINTVSTPTAARPPQQRLQTCLDNYDCIANVPAALCDSKKGTVVNASDARCAPPFVKQQLCNGAACKNCVIGGVTVANGDQWCGTNDDSVRKDGLDPVGSRFLKLSCIDGVVHEEPCRDFREQFCTENGAIAGCRENRWYDCWKQTDQQSCEDMSKRDCMWSPGLVPSPRITFEVAGRGNDRCMPLVGPGLEHWTNSGKLVCQVGSEQVREDIGVFSQAISWTPPVVHSDGQAQFCYALGDCGNKVNLVNLGPKKQYKSTTGKPDTALARTTEKVMLSVPLNVNASPGVAPDNFNYPQGDVDYMDQQTDKYIAWWLAQDPIAVLMDAVPLWIRHSAHCKVYKAYARKKLTRCEECMNATGGCSKYVCKSLGRSCIYTEDADRFPHCTTPGTEKDMQVTLQFPGRDVVSIPSGYRFKDPLNPYEKFNVTILTDQPAICTFDFMPGWQSPDDVNDETSGILQFVDFFSQMVHSQDNDAFDPDFREPTTNITLAVETPDMGIMSSLQLGGINLISAIGDPSSIPGMMTDQFLNKFSGNPALKDQIASLKPKAEALANSFGVSIKQQAKTTDNSLASDVNKVNLLLSYNDFMAKPPTLRLYMKCEDEGGEPTNAAAVIEIPVKPDVIPPSIINVSPAPPAPLPAAITFKTSEPATCAYAYGTDAAYDDMTPMSCDVGRLSNRECVLQPQGLGPRKIFVKCRDRPFAFIYGSLKIHKGDGHYTAIGGGVTGLPDAINFTVTPFYRTINLDVGTDKDTVPFNLIFDSAYICKWSTQNVTYPRMADMMLCDQQTCSLNVPTGSGTTINFICADSSGDYQNTNTDSYVYDYS